MWTKIKDEAGRFDLANAQPEPAVPVITAVKGDIDANGSFEKHDIELLRDWLTAEPGTVLNDWQAGDLNSDGKLNGIDLTLLKRLMFADEAEPVQPETPSADSSAFIAANIAKHG